MHVESGDELVSNSICLALDDGVSVWWVVAKIIGEGVGVDGRVGGGELGHAAGTTDRNTETQQLTRGCSS